MRICHSCTLAGEETEAAPATNGQWGCCEAKFQRSDGWPDSDRNAVAADGCEALLGAIIASGRSSGNLIERAERDPRAVALSVSVRIEGVEGRLLITR